MFWGYFNRVLDCDDRFGNQETGIRNQESVAKDIEKIYQTLLKVA